MGATYKAVANAVLFLASGESLRYFFVNGNLSPSEDESDFVNGETLVIDNTLTTGIRFEKLFLDANTPGQRIL